jgi:hypothetical protein
MNTYRDHHMRVVRAAVHTTQCVPSLTSETVVEHSRQKLQSDCTQALQPVSHALSIPNSQSLFALSLLCNSKGDTLQTKRFGTPNSPSVAHSQIIPATVLCALTPTTANTSKTTVLSALTSHNTPTPTRGCGGSTTYQRRPMLRMQRLCISLLSGLVS